MFLFEVKMHMYFDTSGDGAKIRNYIRNSSIGDWFVLYQMSKSINKKLFLLFLAGLTDSSVSYGKERYYNDQGWAERETCPQDNERWSSFVTCANQSVTLRRDEAPEAEQARRRRQSSAEEEEEQLVVAPLFARRKVPRQETQARRPRQHKR